MWNSLISLYFFHATHMNFMWVNYILNLTKINEFVNFYLLYNVNVSMIVLESYHSTSVKQQKHSNLIFLKQFPQSQTHKNKIIELFHDIFVLKHTVITMKFIN